MIFRSMPSPPLGRSRSREIESELFGVTGGYFGHLMVAAIGLALPLFNYRDDQFTRFAFKNLTFIGHAFLLSVRVDIPGRYGSTDYTVFTWKPFIWCGESFRAHHTDLRGASVQIFERLESRDDHNQRCWNCILNLNRCLAQPLVTEKRELLGAELYTKYIWHSEWLSISLVE